MFNARKKKRDQFRSVFLSTDEGKAVLGHIYKICGYNSRVQGNDPNESHANAARHGVAQKIASILNQSEEDVWNAIKSAQSSILVDNGEK